MDLQQLFDEGMSFEVFVPDDNDANAEKLLEIYNGIEIDKELSDRIKSIDKQINILAFAELWCSDCIINLPALKKINDINPKIVFKILPKEYNEKYMENRNPDAKPKIPTFVILNDKFEEIGTFIENPGTLSHIIGGGNEVEIIVAKRKYQKGEYVRETIEEIIDTIIEKTT